MASEISFEQARNRATDALAEHYKAKFPERRLVAEQLGRDLGRAWAVFLGLQGPDAVESLIGSPVILVAKSDGAISLAFIPPSFEILDAPMVGLPG